MAKKEYKIPILGGLAESKFKSKAIAWVKIIFFLTLAFSYFAWTMDLIPAKVAGPVIGHIDDAIIFVIVAWILRGSIRTILENKNRFLGR